MRIPAFYEELRQLLEAEDWQGAAARLSKLPEPALTREQLVQTLECVGRMPEEAVKSSPGLCLLAALAGCQLGGEQEARRWYNALVALREGYPEEGAGRRALDRAVYCAVMAMPRTDNANLLLFLSILYNQSHGQVPREGFLSATGRRPSVLRGAKDLSDWGRNYSAVRSIVRPMLGTLLEDRGRGACEAAVAELLYERGENYGASLEAAGAASAQTAEIAFSGLALLARAGCYDPEGRRPAEALEQIAALIEEREAEALERLLDAMREK